MDNAKEYLKKKGIHPTEPIYWDLKDKTINLDELLDEYAQQQVKNTVDLGDVMHWVAVKDRLPEDGGYFICCLENGAVTECQYEIIQNKWWLGLEREVRQHNKVVYWMNKPEPPCA